MRILLDEALPLRAADTEILDFARIQSRTCITLDHDFHRILAATGASQPSVVLLRAHQTGYVATAGMVARLLNEFPRELEDGVALTAGPRGVRFRCLPLK